MNKKNIMGAFLGAGLAGDTGEDGYEVLPTIAGAGLGATISNFLDTGLPNQTFKEIKTKVDMGDSLKSSVSTKDNLLNKLRNELDNYIFEGDVEFNPKNIFNTITHDNYNEALSYLGTLDIDQLKDNLLKAKTNTENPYIPLADTEGNFKLNPYTPEKIFVSDLSTLEDRKLAMTDYLTNIKGESSEFAEKRVRELEPFLKNINGHMRIEDGVLNTRMGGENISLHLTTTLNDGITHGYSSNNNAYLAKKFNIVGGLIAEGRGKQDQLEKISEALKLDKSSQSYESLSQMLIQKDGITKEAALGFLADIGVKDKPLVQALNLFEDSKQWDEKSTELLLDNNSTQTTEYAKTVGNSVSAEHTIRFNKGSLDLNLDGGKSLRSLGTVAYDSTMKSEVNLFKDALLENDFDFFSHTKADANLLYSSRTMNTDMPSMFVPFNRNANTVTNRSVGAPTINPNRKTKYDDAFEYFKQTFKGNSTLSSAVSLRAETYDMEEAGDLLSKVMGSNITLADGYSIANRKNIGRFEATGQDSIKLRANTENSIVAQNPLTRKLIEGEHSIDDLKYKSNSSDSFLSNNRLKSLSKKSFEHIFNISSEISSSDNYYESSQNLLKSKSFKKQSERVLETTDDEIKRLGVTKEQDKLELLRRNVISSFEKKATISSSTSTDFTINSFYDVTRNNYNNGILGAIDSIRNGNMEEARDMFKGIEDNYQNSYRESYESSSFISPKKGSTIGYDIDGTPLRMSRTFSEYQLDDVKTRVNSNGSSLLEFNYKGKLNLGENFVGKGFSINAKEQFGLIDKEEFGYAGTILDLHKKGYIRDYDGRSAMIDGSLLASDKDKRFRLDSIIPLLQDKKRLSEQGYDLVSNTRRHFQNNVDMISDNSNTGFKNERQIQLDLINGEKNSKYLTKTSWESLLEFKEKNGIRDVQGLVDFGLATTNEKASLATLANTVMNNKVRFDKLETDYNSLKTINEDQLRKHFRNLVPNFTSNSTGQELIRDMRNSMDEYHLKVADMFGTKSGVYGIVANSQERETAIGFFNNSHSFVKDYRKTRINISALNRTAVTETGAGKTEKRISWNAQSQLLSNGYTNEELDMLGKFNKGAYNDVLALTGMNEHHSDSINSKINSKNLTAFKNAFNSTVEERRDLFQGLGINTNKNVDFYNLSYSPKGSFKSLPIIYDESKILDTFSDKINGRQTNKKAISLMYDIINLDREYSEASDQVTAKSIQRELDKRHSQLQGHFDPSLSGSSNIAKTAFTREAESSVQSTVGAVNGNITDFLQSERNSGRHGSYVSVSEEGLKKRLGLSGLSTKDVELQKIDETLSKVVVKSDNLPLFGFVNREPATGPMSVRLSEYLVDHTIKGNGSKDSLFIKSEDDIYKYFQFGDYDFDNVTEYFVNNRKNQSFNSVKNMYDKGVKIAEDYDNLKGFAEKLGVKNNKSDKMASLFEVFEKHAKDIKSESDWHEKYLSYLNKTTTQAGYRKVVSAPVTMLSASLNNSLLQSATDTSSTATQASRVLTHYFVENLLKAQHAKGDENSNATVAEVLSSLRKQAINNGEVNAGAKSKYLSELRKNLTDMLENHEQKDLKELGKQAVDNIVKAENVYLTDVPTNPMDLGSAGINKTFEERVKNLKKVVLDGEDQAQPIFNRIASKANIETTAKVGYDRLIKAGEHFISSNKKTIGLGLAGLAGISMAFRSNATASTDVGRETLSATADDLKNQPQGMSLNSPRVHLTPHREANKVSAIVEGDYIGTSESMRDNTRRSILGEGIDSVQIEYRE